MKLTSVIMGKAGEKGSVSVDIIRTVRERESSPVGVSRTRQTVPAQSAKRREVFGVLHGRITANFHEPLVSRTSAPCA